MNGRERLDAFLSTDPRDVGCGETMENCTPTTRRKRPGVTPAWPPTSGRVARARRTSTVSWRSSILRSRDTA